MKIEIKRGMREGYEFVDVARDGEAVARLDLLSIEITGAKCESHRGIFQEEYWDHEFTYGSMKTVFKWEKIDWQIDDREEIIIKLKERIKDVREWVSNLNWEETFEMEF